MTFTEWGTAHVALAVDHHALLLSKLQPNEEKNVKQIGTVSIRLLFLGANIEMKSTVD